jgi:hypothetical protein
VKHRRTPLQDLRQAIVALEEKISTSSAPAVEPTCTLKTLAAWHNTVAKRLQPGTRNAARSWRRGVVASVLGPQVGHRSREAPERAAPGGAPEHVTRSSVW